MLNDTILSKHKFIRTQQAYEADTTIIPILQVRKLNTENKNTMHLISQLVSSGADI